MPSPRLDRLLTLSLFRPLRNVVPAGCEGRLPVLMYHSISDRSEAGVAPYYRTATRPEVFAEQMALLKSEGWEAMSLAVGLRAFGSGETSRRKIVALTFDDGFRDFLTAAFPVLRQHGFTATMYLPTAFIGEQPIQFKAHECLAWDDVAELHRAGIEFGSHTVNHPELVRLPWAEVEREVRDSKAEIERHLGAQVASFAYPYAFPRAEREFVSKLRRLLGEAGYENCVTTDIGRVRAGGDLLAIPRLPANDCDDAELLKAKLAGAYDWLAVPQRAVKALKRLVSPRKEAGSDGN
jgi:peptidoglycan/xylan/chitin deacetylase (PgdA/CDA1 family)